MALRSTLAAPSTFLPLMAASTGPSMLSGSFSMRKSRTTWATRSACASVRSAWETKRLTSSFIRPRYHDRPPTSRDVMPRCSAVGVPRFAAQRALAAHDEVPLPGGGEPRVGAIEVGARLLALAVAGGGDGE